MAKIVINPVVGAYASVTAINNRLQQIEDAFNDDILWRGGFTSEPNSMSVDLDMNGFSILNFLVDQSTVGAEFGTVRATTIYQDDVQVVDLSDQHWLGGFAANPTTRNDGVTALAAGDAYFNTVDGLSRTYNGSIWNVLTSSSASNAVDVAVADAGSYFSASPKNVETVLQEIGPQAALITTNTNDIATNVTDIGLAEGRLGVNEGDITALETLTASYVTRGWNLDDIQEDWSSVDISSQTTTNLDVKWNHDGSKFYVLDSLGMIYQWNCSTNYKISTNTYTASFNVGSLISGAQDLRGFAVNASSSRMIFVDNNDTTVKQFTITNGNVLTLAYTTGDEVNVSAEITTPQKVAWNADGTAMVVTGTDAGDSDGIDTYTVSTAYDITSTVTAVANDVATVTNPFGVALHPNGRDVYLNDIDNNRIIKFRDQTAGTVRWEYRDLTSYETFELSDIVTQSGTSVGGGLDFSPNGAQMLSSSSDNKVFQFNMGRMFAPAL